jgi:hypothetical protein
LKHELCDLCMCIWTSIGVRYGCLGDETEDTATT